MTVPTRECPTLSIGEAADELGIHYTTLYKLIARGEAPFPILSLGRRKRVSRYVLDAFLRGELERSAS